MRLWRWWSRTVWSPSGRAQLRRAASGISRSISAQRASASSASKGIPVQSVEQLPQDVAALAVVRDGAERLLKLAQGEVALAAQPREASDPGGSVLPLPSHRPSRPLARPPVPLAQKLDLCFPRGRVAGRAARAASRASSRDGAGRVGHRVAEGTDQDELSVFEQIHDLPVRPRPEHASTRRPSGGPRPGPPRGPGAPGPRRSGGCGRARRRWRAAARPRAGARRRRTSSAGPSRTRWPSRAEGRTNPCRSQWSSCLAERPVSRATSAVEKLRAITVLNFIAVIQKG